MNTEIHRGSAKGQATLAHPEAGSPAAAAQDAPVNILIVDDEPKNLTVLETVLANPGYRLVRAESADQALLALVVEEFALLILDIRMPGMTGFDLAQLIKERKKTARVPIIFLTAYYNEDQHMLEGYGTGAVDYLHKPVNPAILRSKVAVFVELHRKNRESAIANRALLAEVTERRRAEEQLRELNETLDQRVIARSEALRERDEQLRLFAEHAPAAIAMFDAQMRYLAGSQRWLAEHGFQGQDLRGRSYYEFFPEISERWRGIHRRCLAGAVEGAEGDRIEHADGSTQWLRWEIRPWHTASGVVGGIIIFTEDITARKESEKALWKSNERFRKIFIYAATGIAITDLQGRFQQCNPAYGRLAGYSAEELGDMDFSALIHPDDLAESLAALQRLRNGEQPAYEIENRYLHKDGTTVWTHTFLSLLRDDAGQPAHLVALVTDITGRRQSEAALRAAKEVAEAANSSKDRFLAMLSHELRTPLTPALMLAEILQQDARLPAESREQIGIIKRNIDLEARLLDDLLDMTAISKGKLRLRLEYCDAHSLIELAIQIVKDAALAKEITLECELTASHCGFWGDPPRFQQVLWNLLRNAVKFTPRGGRIITRTTHDTSEKDRSRLIIEVIDTGIGIDPGAVEKIFLPFEQGEAAGNSGFGGIGLGLAIARAIVELHGGRINARSDGANRGAIFMVELPGVSNPSHGKAGAAVIATAPKPDAPVHSAENKPPGLVRRILLVEDHSVTLETVSSVLRRWGYEVATASTVTEGLKVAATQTFDLVISDLGLPDGTGITLMKTLRSEYGLRGIALSGYGMEEDLLRSKEAGFIAHLVKPVHLSDLRSLLMKLPHAAR